jgi:hypothetical protein
LFRLVLRLSAIYLAIVGLALMFAPLQFGIGAVPRDASPELVALLRLLGGPFLGIAVLNWMTRNAEPSTTRDAVILANIVGFGAVAANGVGRLQWRSARDREGVSGGPFAVHGGVRRRRADQHADPKRLTPTNDQGRFGYLRGAEPRRGRRTVLTFPLPPPPQKN